VNGLAITGPNVGTLLEIEACVLPVKDRQGGVFVTGIVEEEELGSFSGRRVRRKSMIKSSLETVLAVLRRELGVNLRAYDIYLNFPGGVPVDGSSAGVAIAVAVTSALTRVPVDNLVALTGELSLRGEVKPVGGVVPKVEAAQQAGIKRVLIPAGNWQEIFEEIPVEVIPVRSLDEVFQMVFLEEFEKKRVSL